jgi:hypothetical protein
MAIDDIPLLSSCDFALVISASGGYFADSVELLVCFADSAAADFADSVELLVCFADSVADLPGSDADLPGSDADLPGSVARSLVPLPEESQFQIMNRTMNILDHLPYRPVVGY